MNDRPITIAILAMGGEGGGVLADWIVDMAEHSGYRAQSTSVPGVAQRTGSTIYYIELFPESDREPVLALMPVPGEVDIVVASELMEAGRAVGRGFVTPGRTTLIASSHRVYSMTERTDPGDGRVDSSVLIEQCRSAARKFVCGDFARVAAEQDSVISAALFGAVAAAQALPFTRRQFEEAIRRGGVGVEPSLKAFAAAWTPSAATPASPPPDCESVIRLGVERLTDYQDARYAGLYLQLLAPIRETGDRALLRETARYLALWMSYEDAIRVADLKTRRERFDRLRSEARLSHGQLLRVREYLHPRTGELADILPAALGRWLFRTAWARRTVERLTHGGMLVETTSVTGFLKLYVLAKLRRWRRGSCRFEREHAGIRGWLAVLPGLAKANPALALEVAQYPRLRRGYGDTYDRGCREYEEKLHDALSR
jgi:indolepyruvate ferredoxin oxidoreductase beta subunit